MRAAAAVILAAVPVCHSSTSTDTFTATLPTSTTTETFTLPAATRTEILTLPTETSTTTETGTSTSTDTLTLPTGTSTETFTLPVATATPLPAATPAPTTPPAVACSEFTVSCTQSGLATLFPAGVTINVPGLDYLGNVVNVPTAVQDADGGQTVTFRFAADYAVYAAKTAAEKAQTDSAMRSRVAQAAGSGVDASRVTITGYSDLGTGAGKRRASTLDIQIIAKIAALLNNLEEEEEEDDDFPKWGIALCVILPVLFIGAIVAAVVMMGSKEDGKEAASNAPDNASSAAGQGGEAAGTGSASPQADK